MKTAAIISYSSYHNAYIDRVVKETRKFADYVIVVSHSHFYDGQEDKGLKRFEGSRYHSAVVPWDSGRTARQYHNELRRFGYNLLKSKGFGNLGAYFFIDSDEVQDSKQVITWLKKVVVEGEDYKMANFWYYRDTCYRADQAEEGAVLVSKATLESADIDWFGPRERENYSKKWNYKSSYNNKVLGHHYSWAGTKAMLLRKVQSWGHNADGVDWEAMIKEEFTHGFQGCPFRPNYTFQKVEPYVKFTVNRNNGPYKGPTI